MAARRPQTTNERALVELAEAPRRSWLLASPIQVEGDRRARDRRRPGTGRGWGSTCCRSVGTPAPARSARWVGRPVRNMTRASLVPMTGAPLRLLQAQSLACSRSPSRRPRGRKPVARARTVVRKSRTRTQSRPGGLVGMPRGMATSRRWMQESAKGLSTPTPGRETATSLRSSSCRTRCVPVGRRSPRCVLGRGPPRARGAARRGPGP